MKIRIKMLIDLGMTILLLLLMAYQITGQRLHEWFGAGELLLFLVHNILNIRWYAALCRGKYTLLRAVQTLINFAVLFSILCLGYSGIIMSRHVFAVFPINGPMATARILHLAASYWGFVLMGVHLGLHWGMVTGMFRKICGSGQLSAGKGLLTFMVWLMRIAAAGIAGYGMYCFHKADIVSYMFLKAQFVFFDFEQSAVSVLLSCAAMMGFWIFVSYYAAKGIRKISLAGQRRTVSENRSNNA